MNGKTADSRLVVAVIPTDYAPGRAELRGVSDAAARLGWALEVIDWMRDAVDMSQFLPLLSKADGAIVRLNGPLADGTLSRLGIPIVGIDVSGEEARRHLWASLRLAERKVGETAADELAAIGRRCLAFVPVVGRDWTKTRGKAFVARARALGCDARYYSHPQGLGWAERRAAFSRYLAALPRPFGVFAGTDALSRFVFGACAAAGLKIPEDAAVIGADDDETVCLSSSPHLSSIRIDFEGAGRKAVELLASLMGRPRPARHVTVRFQPLGVSRRASTRTVSDAADPRVSAALDFIAMHAQDPSIGAADVARAMFVCRRQADRLFRATGKSIREHIEDARIERVKALLRTGGRTVAGVAAECGFASASYLSSVFRRKTGSSIRAWRR